MSQAAVADALARIARIGLENVRILAGRNAVQTMTARYRPIDLRGPGSALVLVALIWLGLTGMLGGCTMTETEQRSVSGAGPSRPKASAMRRASSQPSRAFFCL